MTDTHEHKPKTAEEKRAAELVAQGVPEADAVEQARYEAKTAADNAAQEGTQHRA